MGVSWGCHRGCSFAIGLVAAALFARGDRAFRWARKTKPKSMTKFSSALQQPLMFLFIIIGLSIIVQWIPFGADAEDILVKILQSFIVFNLLDYLSDARSDLRVF